MEETASAKAPEAGMGSMHLRKQKEGRYTGAVGMEEKW